MGRSCALGNWERSPRREPKTLVDGAVRGRGFWEMSKQQGPQSPKGSAMGRTHFFFSLLAYSDAKQKSPSSIVRHVAPWRARSVHADEAARSAKMGSNER